MRSTIIRCCRPLSRFGRNFICSRILHDGVITSPTADTVVHEGDKLRIVAGPRDKEAIVAFCGEEDTKIDLATAHSPLVSRLISVTREEVNGALIEDLHLANGRREHHARQPLGRRALSLQHAAPADRRHAQLRGSGQRSGASGGHDGQSGEAA